VCYGPVVVFKFTRVVPIPFENCNALEAFTSSFLFLRIRSSFFTRYTTPGTTLDCTTQHKNPMTNGYSPILNPLLYSMMGSKFRKTAKVRNLILIGSWITSSDWTISKSLFRRVFKKVKIRPNHLHAINYRRF